MAELQARVAAAVATPEHDFASNWEPVPDWRAIRIEGRGVTVSIACLELACIINGNLSAALQAASIGSEPVGWPELANGDAYAVRLARDRALFVGGAALAPGWNNRGFAVSRSEDACIAFDVSGSGVQELLSLGASVFFDKPSASAVRLFAGLPVILYRHGHDHAVRLHVARPRAAAMLRWLRISVAPHS